MDGFLKFTHFSRGEYHIIYYVPVGKIFLRFYYECVWIIDIKCNLSDFLQKNILLQSSFRIKVTESFIS